ncbi:hypothetical protein [Streptomyces sp. NBC_01012]|uniref:hypothetical protein n=1 Tax=Streptomyces sp. NBC_01012 TaxID=2903717 RepID=UPI003864C0DB|nr:hypothetical protein OG623_11900 [Streptomyces sp. NBC_01012]
MTAFYDFLTVRRPAPPAMAAALASLLGVENRYVDVADEDTGQTDERDWDAPVLCTHRAVAGDLAASWDISVSDAVRTPPTEADAALKLAVRLGTTVLYSAREQPPSAYWAAGPDGTVARARVLEGSADGAVDGAPPEDVSGDAPGDAPGAAYGDPYAAADDDGPPVLVVDQVEAPMKQLPAARVGVIAEILDQERVETPVADAFAAATDPHGDAPPAGTVNRAREALLLWERLVRRIDTGWPPDGRYPFGLYIEDLRTRERLSALAEIAGAERELLVRAVAELDELFRRGTEEDAGALLGSLTRSGSAVAGRGWWWHRRPVKQPWDS